MLSVYVLYKYEDYLELIEHLPQELRDRFTDIRERDLQVHNSTEQLKEKVKQFFANASNLNSEQRQCDYEKLLNEYDHTTKYADDKVQIASQMHEIMIKLVQKLDSELEKFKLELEADHAGITEELERRSLELDADTQIDEIIGSNLNHSQSSTSTTRVPSGIKDRRRSEHKNRHHPYQNNQDNGYHGRAKLSHNDQHNLSKDPFHHRIHHNHHRQGSKFNHNNTNPNNGSTSRYLGSNNNSHSLMNTTSSTPSISAPSSIAGDNLANNSGTEVTRRQYGNNLYSFNDNSGSTIPTSSQDTSSDRASFNHQHSALSAALASASPHMSHNGSGVGMMHSSSLHNKISNNGKGGDLIDPNFPFARQNPLAAAASQAIAATQQVYITPEPT